MLGFLPTRAYRPGTPGATTFLSPLSGTFNYGWDSFGFDGIKVTYTIDADATPDEIKAVVAQSQKRSAVYDAITNPTNVTVEVN